MDHPKVSTPIKVAETKSESTFYISLCLHPLKYTKCCKTNIIVQRQDNQMQNLQVI